MVVARVVVELEGIENQGKEANSEAKLMGQTREVSCLTLVSSVMCTGDLSPAKLLKFKNN
jgi:hypothetical protein